MTLATREQILSAQDWDYEEFEVPKWGRVRIRALSAGERLQLVTEFGSGQLTNEQAFAFFTRLIAQSLVDETGRQLFDTAEDIPSLQTRSWQRLQFVADRIMAFNGMTQEDGKELEKN